MTPKAIAEHNRVQPATSVLRSIRDQQDPSSRGTAKGGLVAESFAVFQEILQGLPASEVRSGILDGRILQKTSIATRRSIWMALRHRYFYVPRGTPKTGH
jgi:hypothetical protein